MNLRPSKHLESLAKEVSYDDYSGDVSRDGPLFRTGKSYCGNSEVFHHAYFPRPERVCDGAYAQLGEFLWRHCS